MIAVWRSPYAKYMHKGPGDLSHQICLAIHCTGVLDAFLQLPRRDNSQGNIMPYVVPYLKPILVNNQYLLILLAFLYGLVTPSPAYGVSGWPQAFFFRYAFLNKCVSWLKMTVFVNMLSIFGFFCGGGPLPGPLGKVCFS